jgi:hypothetical protein
MARIKGLGELEFSHLSQFDEKEIDEATGEVVLEKERWSFVCRLRLDNPIKIEQDFLDYYYEHLRRTYEKFTFHNVSFFQVEINRGQILVPLGAAKDLVVYKLRVEDFENDPNFEMKSADLIDFVKKSKDFIIVKKLLPKNIVRAFQKQNAYEYITVGLYPDLSRPEAEHLCDLEIEIPLNREVKNTDRLLQAFARKLNKWLAATR